jgi:hypothetical protein
MHQVIPNRIVIYAKDIKNITGRKERAARKLIAKIRKKYKKERVPSSPSTSSGSTQD